MTGRSASTKTAKAKGSGKRPVNTPASGIPAKGPGWGGQARGAAMNRPGKHPDFTPETAAEYQAMPVNVDRKALKLQRSLEMEDIILSIAKDTEQHGSVRMQAAAKLYEMYNGKPVERVITDEQPIERDVIDPAELSPEAREELRAALERQRAAEAEATGKVH